MAVLVPEVGFDGNVFIGPERRGLARALYDRGFHLVFSRPLTGSAWPPPAVGEALARAAREYPGLPIVGVGHGLGGTALLAASDAPSTPTLAGLVLMSAPVAFGGESRAVRRLLANPRAKWPEAELSVLWGELGGHQRRTWALRTATVRLPRGLLQLAGRWGRGRATPTIPPKLRATLRSNRTPILVLLAQASGLAPPWRCDPAGLGLRRKHIQRHYLARAHRHELDYNHVDLLLHPDARGDVFPLIEAWLETTAR